MKYRVRCIFIPASFLIFMILLVVSWGPGTFAAAPGNAAPSEDKEGQTVKIAGVLSAICSAQERIVIEGDFTAAKAMKRIYGNFDDGKKVSVWKPGITCDHKTFDRYYDADQIKEVMGDDDFEARVASIKRFRANGSDKYYMLTATTWADCHACRPVLGVFLWKKQKGGLAP